VHFTGYAPRRCTSLGVSGLSRGPVSSDHLDAELLPLPAQLDKPRTTADRAALLVGDVFRGPRVALSNHLRDCTTEFGLLRLEQHDALDVALDEVVIVILLKDLSSRMTKSKTDRGCAAQIIGLALKFKFRNPEKFCAFSDRDAPSPFQSIVAFLKMRNRRKLITVLYAAEMC
jgi:hypothetical protein